MMRRALPVAGAALLTAAARLGAQSPFALDSARGRPAEGWQAFGDVSFLVEVLLALALATLLGAVIAYHPMSRRTADSLEDAEAPKVYLMYAVIGATIGVMVLQYGAAVGFVVFGIGGLIRFRTDMQSAPRTGRLILVTLVGLAAGMRLPHLAVITTAFGFVLIYALDARVTYRMDVKGLGPEAIASAAEAYRAVLERAGCRVLSEKKSFVKDQITFIFRAPHRLDRHALAQRLEHDIPRELAGTVDWEMD